MNPSETPPSSPPKKGGKLLWVLAGLVAAALIVLSVLEARQGAGVPKGSAAPEVRLPRYGGGSLSLSELRGKVVMLDFWATWCAPCLQEMPSLMRLAKEYESQGLVLVAASRDDADVAEYLVKQLVERQMPDLGPYVVFANDEVARTYEVNALPTLYFLDREGKVSQAQRGALTEEELRKRIEMALAAGSP